MHGAMYLWPLDFRDLVEIVRRTVRRNLTFSEWKDYFGRALYRRTFDDLPPPNDAGRAAE